MAKLTKKQLEDLKEAYCFKNDGKSYLRIANEVQKLLDNIKLSFKDKLFFKINFFVKYFLLKFIVFNFFEDIRLYLIKFLKKYLITKNKNEKN